MIASPKAVITNRSERVTSLFMTVHQGVVSREKVDGQYFMMVVALRGFRSADNLAL
jgi:hypothetical protein